MTLTLGTNQLNDAFEKKYKKCVDVSFCKKKMQVWSQTSLNKEFEQYQK